MCKFCLVKLSKNNIKIIIVNLLYVYSELVVDVIGVIEVNVNDSCYLLVNGLVILKGDDEKYGSGLDDFFFYDFDLLFYVLEVVCIVRY